MEKRADSGTLSRRGVLTLAGACLLPWESLYAGEFWNKKDPSQWTGEEIDQLTSKSPWAKSVSATYAPGQNGGYGNGGNRGSMGGPPIGIGGMGYPRGRMGGGRGGYPRGGGGQQQAQYKGTVRWESAQPILDALKTPLPDIFVNHYVIGIRDIPLIDNERRPQDTDDPDTPKPSTPDSSSNKKAIDNLKMFTTLQVKGKDTIEPGVVQQMTPGGTYFLFGFSKEFLDFGKKDHEIDFRTQLGRLQVKTKFDPSEMIYRGKLAV